MAKVINITKVQRGGAYSDVVDFLTHMARTFGNTTNATANLIRSTKEYRAWRAQHSRQRTRKAG